MWMPDHEVKRNVLASTYTRKYYGCFILCAFRMCYWLNCYVFDIKKG